MSRFIGVRWFAWLSCMVGLLGCSRLKPGADLTQGVTACLTLDATIEGSCGDPQPRDAGMDAATSGDAGETGTPDAGELNAGSGGASGAAGTPGPQAGESAPHVRAGAPAVPEDAGASPQMKPDPCAANNGGCDPLVECSAHGEQVGSPGTELEFAL